MFRKRRLDQQHASRLFQEHPPPLATVLAGIDRDDLPMQRAVGVFLTDQLPGRLNRPSQLSKPGQPTPKCAVCQRCPSPRQRMLLSIVINERSPVPADCLAIGLSTAQEVLRLTEQRLADKLFVTQSERGGSR